MTMPTLDRREFMGRALAGAGAFALAGAAPQQRRAADRVPLGKTGLRVSRVGMGTGVRGGGRESNQVRAGFDSFSSIVQRCWEKGLNFFDAADSYGSHGYFRGAFARLKIPADQIVVSTKLDWRSSPTPSAAIERFRLELDRDVLDLVLLHCLTDKNWWERGEGGKGREKKAFEALQDAKAKGKVRGVGASCHTIEALRIAAETPGFDYHLVRINHVGKEALMDASPDEVVPVIKKMHDDGRGIGGMKIVGEGKLRDQIDASLKFVLGLGTVDTMAIGFEKPDEIDDFVARTDKVLNG
jgi:aryl-alcohol dehydrogenase-like predicted oxidoreductase